MSTVSIVMSAYDRAHLLGPTLESIRTQTRLPDQIVIVEDGNDGGKTEGACEKYKALGLPIEYYCRRNRPSRAFSNPGIVRNIAIKRARGEILIIQEAEVKYTKNTDIQNLVVPVEADKWISMFAPCRAIKEDGSEGVWYGDPNQFHYSESCHAVRLEHVLALGGYNENFVGYGREDDDFNWRLKESGIIYKWATDVLVLHQWHHGYPGLQDAEDDKRNFEYGSSIVYAYQEVRRKGLLANIGKDWGNIDS